MVDLYVILNNKIIALFLDESNQTKHGLTSIKEILVLVQMCLKAYGWDPLAYDVLK